MTVRPIFWRRRPPRPQTLTELQIGNEDRDLPHVAVERIERRLRTDRDNVLPKSSLRVAIQYAFDQWPAMSAIWTLPGRSSTNDIVERDIKRVVIGAQGRTREASGRGCSRTRL